MPAEFCFPRPSQRAPAIAAISRTAAGTRIFQCWAASDAAVSFDDAEEGGITVAAEPEDGDGARASGGGASCEAAATTPELAAATVPELAAVVNPLWVSRLSRCNSERISEAC